MYRIIIVLFIQVLLAQVTLAQEDSPKFTFSEVVRDLEVDSLTLLRNAEKWIGKHKFNEVIEEGNKIRGNHSFYVYQKGIVSKQIHGKITYTASLEIKDKRYRYTFDNFVFHYYKVDRNLKYVPSGKTKLLEESHAPGWEKTWSKHKVFAQQQMTILIRDLKEFLNEAHQIQRPPLQKEEDF